MHTDFIDGLKAQIFVGKESMLLTTKNCGCHDSKPGTFAMRAQRSDHSIVFIFQTLLQKMPHILPQAERVRLFKKAVEADKEVSGLTESACLFPRRTHITVHRSRIVEDGYRQLAALPPLALKGVVRVHFVNEQGLSEAGIDQDGVFKGMLKNIEILCRVVVEIIEYWSRI